MTSTAAPDSKRRTASAPPRAPSRGLQRFVGWYARRYVQKHLHALRVRLPQPPAIDARTPVIVYLNHASWWDPLVAFVIARELFSDRVHHAPIDARGLEKHPFLSRIGFFGIEPGTVRGTRAFLDATSAICATRSSALWLTPQGRFADPRERPPRLAPGLGHLVSRLERAWVLPLAVEYPFWEERTAEALALAGRPFVIGCEDRATPDEWTSRLELRLESAQDELAALSRTRDPLPFRTLVSGCAGVGGIYDAWRAAVARLRGRTFRREHGDGP